MNKAFKEKLEEAVWIAHSLFKRQKTSGSSANLSFRHQDEIWISATGSCFGTLRAEQFACMRADGSAAGDVRPSKEYPLHRLMYERKPDIGAVVHTHGPYSTLWSCLEPANTADVLPAYTPYLRMKLGRVAFVPYAKPGSEELFSLFGSALDSADGYLLANHGPVVGARTLMDAFYALEELEESARLAWLLRGEPNAQRLG
jgi:ribulose-5-phosphate 4-epimerase/fuculose-1-phosphate aldolase